MSDKKPLLTDKESLAAFKRFFDIESGPIETAYQEVDRLTGEIANCHTSMLADRQTAEAKQGEATQLWVNLAKPGHSQEHRDGATQKASALQDEVAGLEERIQATAEQVEKLQTELDTADERKKAAPKEAATKHIKALGERLANAGLSLKGIKADTQKTVNKSLSGTIDAETLELAVKALDAEVEELCAPIELQKKQQDIASRLDALGKKPFRDEKAIADIGALRDANQDNIAVLNGEVETQLKKALEQSNEFEQRIKDLGAPLQKIGQCQSLDLDTVGYPGLVAAEKQLRTQGAVNEQTFDALFDLEEKIAAAQQAAADTDETKKVSEKRYNALEKEHLNFRKRSDAHENVKNIDLGKAKGKLTEAWNLMQKLEFEQAMQRLDDAELYLDDLDELVIGKDKKDKEKKDAAALLLKEAEEQRAREEADTVAALDAIGRDGKLRQWLTKAGRLIDLGLLSCSAGAPLDLNKNGVTVEVSVTLTPVVAEDVLAIGSFVVHYHPRAASLKKNPFGSPMHCKAWKSAPKNNNLDIGGGIAWVGPLVPRLTVIRQQF